MKKLLIAILIFLLGGGGGFYATNQLGGGGGSNYVTSVIMTTTTVPMDMQSIYYPDPTSTDIAADITVGTWPWVAATSTTGKPLKILSGTARAGFECCLTNNRDATTTIWMSKAIASSTEMTTLTTSTNMTSGFQIGWQKKCFNTYDYNIVWGGNVYVLGEGSGILHCADFIY